MAKRLVLGIDTLSVSSHSLSDVPEESSASATSASGSILGSPFLIADPAASRPSFGHTSSSNSFTSSSSFTSTANTSSDSFKSDNRGKKSTAGNGSELPDSYSTPMSTPTASTISLSLAGSQSQSQSNEPVTTLKKTASRSVGKASGSSTPTNTLRKNSVAGTLTQSPTVNSDAVTVKEKDVDKKNANQQGMTLRYRSTPHLHVHNAEPAPPTLMYWSRAPVYGTLPNRGLRAHSVTMVDHIAWLFGGCDLHDCFRDIWCLDTETLEWTHPDVVGDTPPPFRAHSATLVDRRIFIFGGGGGSVYSNELYIFDTVMRRWTHVPTPSGQNQRPIPRRAHTAVLHRNRLIVFGGGNGVNALNDIWWLDTTATIDEMKWQVYETKGDRPSPRGYHTANLVGDVMVVIGGSDGRTSYSDIWCLNFETNLWSIVKSERSHRRLAHSSTQIGSYLFIMGGHDGTAYVSDLHLFNLVSLQYEHRPTLGRHPSIRGYHAAALADGRLFIFGGFNGSEVFDDIYHLDLAGAAYLPQVTSFVINVE